LLKIQEFGFPPTVLKSCVVVESDTELDLSSIVFEAPVIFQ